MNLDDALLQGRTEAEKAAFRAAELAAVVKIRAEAQAAREKKAAERARAEERARGPASVRNLMIGGSDLPSSVRDMAVKDD